MKISTRAQNMPESPIRKLAKYADAAKRNGVHIYHLNIGQPDLKTPRIALDALKKIDRDIHRRGRCCHRSMLWVRGNRESRKGA